ncbi:hypothetical protein, partial [Moorena sp. SIO4A5]|uniref:hypothetical protein n=1 Tax=Moorena sp. SIO4A5 TaxID=2607838 RepID=UPI0025E7636E
QATERPWMSIYLRILAFVFAYGAIVHFGNIAGFGEMPWLETPLTWRIGDVFYGILDTVAVIGLGARKVWGIGLCLSCSAFRLGYLNCSKGTGNREQGTGKN